MKHISIFHGDLLSDTPARNSHLLFFFSGPAKERKGRGEKEEEEKEEEIKYEIETRGKKMITIKDGMFAPAIIRFNLR